MLSRISVRGFKSLEDVSVDLGHINVFVGSNGGGKSNLLEALGVLSAAANGRVDDAALLQRGVRPGVPKLYKSAFAPRAGEAAPKHIRFEAASDLAEYKVSLQNPLDDPQPAWRYKHEEVRSNGNKRFGRGPASMSEMPADRGQAALQLAALKATDPAAQLLTLLQDFVIFAPSTAVLRGTSPETQPREPVGLSGGRLAVAVNEMLRQRGKSKQEANPTEIHGRKVCESALSLIPWAASYGSMPTEQMQLSASAAAGPRVIKFVDRFMSKDRNILSGYDASEGALYVLFLAVLASHSRSPRLFAVDNADHGLNPRLARSLLAQFCSWVLEAPEPRQVLLTTHNPLVLDGLPLADDRVRLFTVGRTSDGRTAVQRVVLTDRLKAAGERGWTMSRLWVAGDLPGGIQDV